MSSAIDKAKLAAMTADEKLQLIDELWNSLDAEPEIGLTPDQLAEMERRLAWAQANPDKCLTLEEFRKRLRTVQ
ncbi:MAG: addiction module protein [Planctomycetes bacterium]|nr:addiction module protein [Planctomycetota bacterium]MCW8135270.1 addiction module protein [Planctomycetota bacterium]